MINEIKEIFEKSKQRNLKRKEKFWKLKREERLEYLEHIKFINETSDRNINFINVPIYMIKIIFLILAFLFLYIIAFPESKLEILKLILVITRVWKTLIIYSFIAGIFVDLINISNRSNRIKGLNKRFKLN
ncbi:MAG: hypothetical protein ACFFC1_19185 [Promethearchaeota archaeon]